jgi:hypothetical protein
MTGTLRQFPSAACRPVRLILFVIFILGPVLASTLPAVAGSLIDLTPEQLARRKIASFQASFDPEIVAKLKAQGLSEEAILMQRKIYAFELSNDYYARRLLKTPEFQELGKEYFKSWFEGGEGLAHRIIARAKVKLGGTYSDEVLNLIQIIQNQASRDAMKAPMDFDMGILTGSREEARKVLDMLGGPGGIKGFHENLQQALEEAYLEIFKELGGTNPINPKRAFLSATTGWHPEAYADTKVLKKGGVASKDLVQQTVDVSKYKVSEMRKLADEGVLTAEEAMEEAARGTVKDLDKVDRVFRHLEKLTGVRPQFTVEQEAISYFLRQVEAMEMDVATANQEILRISNGRLNIFSACDQLMDQMEAAWRLRQAKPQEMLLALFAEFLEDADYDKAFKALVEGSTEDLPPAARKLIEEVRLAGEARFFSLRRMSTQDFLKDFLEEFPQFKIASKPGSDSLQFLVDMIEAGSTSEDIVTILGKERAEHLQKIRGLMTERVKERLRTRFSNNKFLLWEVDKKGQALFGDPEGGLGTLGVDAVMGLAMAFWQTASIMDQNLPPDEESRQILNAWGTALPIVGDIAQGMIEGIEGYYEGDRSKYFKAGVWLMIGAAGFVPGLQVPALVAGLGLATYEASSSVFEIQKDKNLLEAWIASGRWDKDQGTLQGLTDAKDTDHEVSFEGVITGGNVEYKDGLAGTTIRDSLYMYAERSGLDANQKLQSYITALKNIYPDFPFKETLREPLRTGKALFAAKILEAGGKPNRSVEMLMFVKAKQIEDTETNRAAMSIQAQVEAEYQARHRVGEADRIFKELQALGRRLSLPLYENVEGIFNSFSNFVVQAFKSPWVRESFPRRRVQLAERYLAGYLEVEKSLQKIREVFKQAGVFAPGFNLSGFLEIDAPRIRDLETAYVNRALGEPGQAVQQIHREKSGDANYVFRLSQPDPCDAELFKQLAGIMVRIVEAEDRKLLLEQWTGKKSAAEQSRDESLRRAQDATESMKTSSVVTMPAAVWDSFCENYEAAYAWANVRWEGSQVYEDAIRGQQERIEKLNAEYAVARDRGADTLGQCVAQAPQGSIQLSNANPNEGDTVTAKIVLSKGQTPKGAEWTWQATGGLELANTSGEQTNLTARSSGSLSATLNLGPKRLGQLQAAVTVKPKETKDPKEEKKPDGSGPSGSSTAAASGPSMKFAGVSPGNWEGGVDKNGVLTLGRKAAKRKAECGEASVTASLTAEYHKSFSKSDPKNKVEAREAAEKSFKFRRQGDTPNDMAVGLFMGGGIEGVSSISMGDFEGAIVDFAIWVRRGSGSPWSGYSGSYMGANGSGKAVKEGVGYISFSYKVWGGGCWDNSDRAYLITQSASAQQEAKAILASLQLVPDGEIKQEPYKGPNYDGSDLPKVALSPSALEKLKPGDTVKVEAVVQNAKPEDSPFTYNWGGTFDGKPEESQKNASIRIKPDKAGKYDLSVSVDGARFNLGGASLKYEVADYKVKVERVPADTKPVPVGVRAAFKATLTVDGQPAKGSFTYRWQPSPEVTFDKLDAATPDAGATFGKPGRVKVWVTVLEQRDGRLATVAESEQIEIEVIKPTIDLAFEPKDPYVGQEVKAKLSVKPDIKEIDFRWVPLGGNAKQVSASQDGREIAFYLTDDKAAEVKVNARVPKTGEDLGEAKNTITAKKYTVTVTGPKAYGPKPQVWKEGVGLVEVDKGFAVDQIVEFSADVQPAPATGPLKYQWSSNGPCTISNPIVREARATASQAGSCDATVVVKDKNDIELGKGAGSYSASITRETIKQGQDQAKKVNDATTKLQSAKDKAKKGQLDEAIQDAKDAAKLDPKNLEASKEAQKLEGDKTRILGQLDKTKKLMDDSKFAEAQTEFVVAKNLSNLYAPVVETEKQLGDKWRTYDSQVRDRQYEVRSANERKEFKKALELAAAMRASMKLHGGNDETLRQQEDWAKRWEAEKEKKRTLLKTGEEKLKQYDYAGSLKAFDEGFQNANNLWAMNDPEPNHYNPLRGEATTKQKRLAELTAGIRRAAEDTASVMPTDVLQTAIKNADEAIALQPNNPELRKYRELIVARLGKTTQENTRLAEGRKHLDAGRAAESDYSTQESFVKANPGMWGEPLEERMQQLLQTAADQYTASLAFIPDANLEKRIKDILATLDGRKKFMANYRQSKALLLEGEQAAKEARSDPSFEASQSKFGVAMDKYRQSLTLYRPSNAEIVDRTIANLDWEMHDRAVKKYWADGQALETAGRILDAIPVYEKAHASYHPTVPQQDRMGLEVHIQDLRNRVNGAMTWRTQGEAQQQAGKIAEAIASYRQSLKLLPDQALEGHVRLLEASLTSASQQAAGADRLWQEGMAFFGQSRYADALAKFKESLQLAPDPQRAQYVKDLEARKAKAQALRDDAYRLQTQSRIPEAVGKYKESLTAWPDAELEKYLRQVEASQASTTASGKLQPPAGPGIQVLAGTYGANCRAPHGNKTEHLAAACNGRTNCSYVIDYQVIGDPAVGCSKDYIAEWRCAGDPSVHSATASPEAGFRKGIELACAGTAAAAQTPPPSSTDGGTTWDFESGDLRGWTKTGTAFDFQPTYGDNPTGRNRGQPSRHQGQYWIGTFEKRPRPSDPAGQTQGDGPQGTLTSPAFTIRGAGINFLIGGGCDLNTVRAELLVDGQPALRATGKCTETMERARWDVSTYVGRTAQIRLVDASDGGWGHINFDDVQFEGGSPAVTSASQPSAPPPVDPTGTWRHSPEGTWTISAAAGGRYQAEETGLGNARGPAYFTPAGTFRIDYTTRDGTINGYYEVRIAADGKTATGTVRELNGPRRTGASNWTRVTPVPTAATADVSSGFYLVDLQPSGGKKGAARKLKNVMVDDGSWIRLKATHEKRLTLAVALPNQVPATAVAVVTNLDNAHKVPNATTTTVLTVQTTAGDRTFEFKAGVHTSEWNRSEGSGADHIFPKDTYVGDQRWMAVFTLPSGSVVTGLRFDHRDFDKKYYHGDAAPGFCLRGITLVGSGGAAPGAAAPAAAAISLAAEITNRSKANAHVFLEGEAFGPGNRFAPGESRRVNVTMSRDGRIVFKAGRDGQVLATKTWVGDPAAPNRVPVVVFDDANPNEKLSISTGLR